MAQTGNWYIKRKSRYLSKLSFSLRLFLLIFQVLAVMHILNSYSRFILHRIAKWLVVSQKLLVIVQILLVDVETPSNYHISSCRDLRKAQEMACTKLTSHIANAYNVKHVKVLYIYMKVIYIYMYTSYRTLRTKFYFVYVFLLSFMMEIALRKLWDIFFIVGSWKDLHVFMHVLRHKSVIKYIFRLNFTRKLLFYVLQNIIMWSYTKKFCKSEKCISMCNEKKNEKSFFSFTWLTILIQLHLERASQLLILFYYENIFHSFDEV